MILNYLNCFRFSKFIIKNGKYLVLSKPTKPASGFIKFNTQNSTGQTNVTQRATQNAVIWKTLSEQEKAKYQPSTQSLEAYKKQVQDYQKKYVHPFKKANLLSLIYQKKLIGKEVKTIQEGAKAMKQVFATMTPQLKQALKEEAKIINQENQAKLEKYLIPRLQWDTFAKYKRAHSKANNDEKTLIEQYNKHLQHYQEKFNKFCDKHGIKPAVLKRMMTKEVKQKQAEKIEDRIQKEVNKRLTELKELDKQLKDKESKEEITKAN